MRNEENLTLKDFNGNYSAMMSYFGQMGGKKKAENYVNKKLKYEYEKILNLHLNENLKQVEIAEICNVSQSFVCNFLKRSKVTYLKNNYHKKSQENEKYTVKEILDVLVLKYHLDAVIIKNIIEDNQDAISDEFKL